jgi:hypothetical protein
MNERIEKLAKQVGAVRNVMAMGRHDGVLFTEFELEKFAELIVRECVTRLEQHHPFTKDQEAYLYAISLIEEYFGVNQ